MEQTLALSIHKVYSQMNFGFSPIPLKIVFKEEIPNSVFNRPPSCLRNRILYFQSKHKLSIAADVLKIDDNLNCFTYFDHFDENPASSIIIDSKLHPGYFSKAIGHALAWENSLDTIYFRKYDGFESYFLFHKLFTKSQKNISIVFQDYKTKIPNFVKSSKKNVIDNKVQNFVFDNCVPNLVIAFLNRSRFFQTPLNEFSICSFDWNLEQFKFFVSGLEGNLTLQKLNCLKLLNIKIDGFDLGSFNTLFSYLENIRLISISSPSSISEIDATQLLLSLSVYAKNIREIRFQKLPFRSSFERPNQLLQIFAFWIFLVVLLQKVHLLLLLIILLSMKHLFLLCFVLEILV